MSITELFFHPIVHAMGWTILHSLWQIILIAALWYLAMRMASNSFAAVRYNISLIALVTIPIAFIITFLRQLSVYKNAGQIVSVSFNGEGQATFPGGPAIFLLDKSHPAFLSHFEAYTQVVCWTYILGLILFSGWHLLSYSNWYRIKKKHSSLLPDELWQKVKEISQRLGMPKKPVIRLSDKVDVPLVVGFFKPFVLLPIAIMSSLTTEQVEVIILHELYHIRRKDHLVNAFQCLIETLFFYHPATWWISKQLRHEREQRVDEFVVQYARQPSLYANALLNIETYHGSRALQPALAATQSKSKLFIRIKNFTTMKTRKFNNGQKFAAVLALATAMVALVWINPAKTVNSVKEIGSLMQADDMAYLHEEPSSFKSAPQKPVNLDEKESVTIHLHNGEEFAWEGLSKQDREKINKAIEESKQASEEVRKALEEMRLKMDSDDFRREMEEAKAEIRKAMEEMEDIDWQEIRREVEEAMKEANEGLKEVSKGLNELSPVLNDLLQEVGKGLQEFGPVLQEVVSEVGKGLQELQPFLRDLMQEIEVSIEKAIEEAEKENED